MRGILALLLVSVFLYGCTTGDAAMTAPSNFNQLIGTECQAANLQEVNFLLESEQNVFMEVQTAPIVEQLKNKPECEGYFGIDSPDPINAQLGDVVDSSTDNKYGFWGLPIVECTYDLIVYSRQSCWACQAKIKMLMEGYDERKNPGKSEKTGTKDDNGNELSQNTLPTTKAAKKHNIGSVVKRNMFDMKYYPQGANTDSKVPSHLDEFTAAGYLWGNVRILVTPKPHPPCGAPFWTRGWLVEQNGELNPEYKAKMPKTVFDFKPKK